MSGVSAQELTNPGKSYSFSVYLLIFCKQVRTTGELVMIHIAHKAVIVYSREK